MAAIASRYARAFADAVFEMKLDGNRTVQEVRAVQGVLSRSPELQRVWENPSIPADQKRHLLDAISSKLGVSKPVRNFVAILIDHHRIGMLDDIARQFQHELNERMGLAEAEVFSARELTDPEKQDLERQVERLTGKKVRASYGIDAALLGGAVVKLGSTIYDGSVRGQLQKIKQQLSTT